ncbi:MAG: cytidine deaminase [Cyclobacteriaceae bacterium]|nr:cytidine deaminase [Cyclobacteriaceae bacterium]
MKNIQTFKHLDDLDTESKYLVHKAKDAAHIAYAPYSKFHVGAAVILDDGTLVTGSNQENSSYPLSMCAERVVLYTVATQYPARKIMKMAVVAHRKNHKELVPATSCGACRQVMSEFEERQEQAFEVVMHSASDEWLKCTSAQDMLPYAFKRNNLID